MAADIREMDPSQEMASAPADPRPRTTGVGGPGEALHAVTRLLSVAANLQGAEAVRKRLVDEAREFFGATHAVLLSVASREGTLEGVAASPSGDLPREPLAIDDFPTLRELIHAHAPAAALAGDEAAGLAAGLGDAATEGGALIVPMRSGDAVRHLLYLSREPARPFSADETEVADAFAAAAAASLAQVRLAEEHSAQIARQAALARAAKSLNDSLDLNRVLVRICYEAASILNGDLAIVYRGTRDEGLSVEATYGMPPEALGYKMEPGSGLAGKVAQLDRPLITNDYQGMPGQPDAMLFGDVHSCLAVPIHWDNKLRGVLAVGYTRSHVATADQLNLLEAFGELAAAACRNASAHAGLAHAARTDGLTGCLNHAADARHPAARDRALRAHRAPALPRAGRHGRLQAGERGERPPRGRRGAAPRRPRPARRPSARTTSSLATAGTSSRSSRSRPTSSRRSRSPVAHSRACRHPWRTSTTRVEPAPAWRSGPRG